MHSTSSNLTGGASKLHLTTQKAKRLANCPHRTQRHSPRDRDPCDRVVRSQQRTPRLQSHLPESWRLLMYHHVKKLMYTVNIGEPDPKFGRMLLEQFGGANGELAAAMQYSIQ